MDVTVTAFVPRSRRRLGAMTILSLVLLLAGFGLPGCDGAAPNATYDRPIDRLQYRDRVKEMFMFAYGNYMDRAFPHDELMPISCQPRIRGYTPSRGDVDDALGNFSLTLLDAMDTLVVIGEFKEFEKTVERVIKTVRFDSDFSVSVFETNIRVVGGLISAHVMAKGLQTTQPPLFDWYKDELLTMTVDIADRILPAFNTTSGLPHPRVNLKRGMIKFLKDQVDTCTACSGTMILEMAALSRLTGKPVYEATARKAMDFLWAQRNHGSDLVGTVLNVENGNWVRREAGIGAGVDSYIEYLLKAYVLLGESVFLQRFNKHYDAVMRYVNKGPMFVDVHMHKPNVASRPYMDSLSAFWPGVLVLKGDLRSAIETHEMLYQVVQKYKFLPEAFTHDFQIHWGQHPLRPEFIESTYLLYRATRDTHYLEVAAQVVDSIEKYTRVECGFAAIKDLRTMEHEDRMDSFVLAETFKYLFMIFSETSELPFDPDNFVLTTEAHFLPLSIGETRHPPRRVIIDPDEVIGHDAVPRYTSACPTIASQFRTADELTHYGTAIRLSVKKLLNHVIHGRASIAAASVGESETCTEANERLRAWAFSSSNPDHVAQLNKMGITIELDTEGRVVLTHRADAAASDKWHLQGVEFMEEMLDINARLEKELLNMQRIERTVQIVSSPSYGAVELPASAALFGMDLNVTWLVGEITFALPLKACEPLKNGAQLAGKIAVVRRGDCMFQEKARFVQQAGGIGTIIIDIDHDSSFEASPVFSMSADMSIEDDIVIPVVFLYQKEAQRLLNHRLLRPNLIVRLGSSAVNPREVWLETIRGKQPFAVRRPSPLANQMFAINGQRTTLRINYLFEGVHQGSTEEEKQRVVEKNADRATEHAIFFKSTDLPRFKDFVRRIGYTHLGYNAKLDAGSLGDLRRLLSTVILLDDKSTLPDLAENASATTAIVCFLADKSAPECKSL